ncbi:MAG: hypothetical protein NTV57_16490 [Cyanobacteria bacterium]|nr:hypothetical protein [Cyanobacteriota bacterium]
MGRDRDPDRIPRAGYEMAPLAGLASLPLGGGSSPLGSPRLLSESTLGAVVVFAIYQALLTALRTEAMVRRSQLDRGAQLRLIGSSVWGSMQDGAAIGLALSLLLLIFPWLSLPLGVLGVVGLGKASLDLLHAFWDGLNDQQKRDLHEAAYAAGVNLNRLLQDGTQVRLDF